MITHREGILSRNRNVAVLGLDVRYDVESAVYPMLLMSVLSGDHKGDEMIWLAVLLVVVVALILVALWRKPSSRQSDDFPYTLTDMLFSPAERSFLGVLDQAVGDTYRIFGKVRVADIAGPQRGLDNGLRQKALNRVIAKHFDFILCDRNDLSVACAIELDDQSHQRRNRQERDAFLAGLCQAIALPLIRMPARRGYPVSALRAQVLDAVGRQTEPVMAPVSVAAPSGSSASVGPLTAPSPGSLVEAPSPVCPRCGAPMVLRRAKAGGNAGQPFWGCSTFPKCRGIVQNTPDNSPSPVA